MGTKRNELPLPLAPLVFGHPQTRAGKCWCLVRTMSHMAKLLRPGESISFVQSRCPDPLWRRIKALGIQHGADKTITQLATVKMMEYIQGRLWPKADHQWLRPKNLVDATGKTGFAQINIPLSNMTPTGVRVLCPENLRVLRIGDLLQDELMLQALIALDGDNEKPQSRELVQVIANHLGVSLATFGYTFLAWLGLTVYPLRPDEEPIKLEVSEYAVDPDRKRARRA